MRQTRGSVIAPSGRHAGSARQFLLCADHVRTAGTHRLAAGDGDAPRDALFHNASFAEQQNGLLAPLKKMAAQVRPDTLIWALPVKLYKMVKDQERTWARR